MIWRRWAKNWQSYRIIQPWRISTQATAFLGPYKQFDTCVDYLSIHVYITRGESETVVFASLFNRTLSHSLLDKTHYHNYSETTNIQIYLGQLKLYRISKFLDFCSGLSSSLHSEMCMIRIYQVSLYIILSRLVFE